MAIGMMVYVQVLLMGLVVFVRVLLMVTGRIRCMIGWFEVLLIGWFEVLLIGSIVVGTGVWCVMVGHPFIDAVKVVFAGGSIGFGLCVVSEYLRG